MKKILFLVGVCAVYFIGTASFVFAQTQEYEGNVPFENSKNVQIHFYLSEDGTEVNKIQFTLDKLEMKPVDKKSVVSTSTLSDAGLTDSTVYKIVDGKITSNAFFVFDLTVIDSCIYGSIKIEDKTDNGTMVAGPVYAVIPNITTPKDIPENILKP